MDGHSAKISGGVQIDGTEIGPIIEDEVLQQAQKIKERNIRSVAIVGIYSPLDEKYSQEHHVRDLLKSSLGEDINIVCSRESMMKPSDPLSIKLLTSGQSPVSDFYLVKMQQFSMHLYFTLPGEPFMDSKEP